MSCGPLVPPVYSCGYGVYRESPWGHAGLYNERRSAERRFRKVGPAYQIAWGQVCEKTDAFIVIDKDRGSDTVKGY
jgi:hypothetical protein